jgi:hypothetical protein
VCVCVCVGVGGWMFVSHQGSPLLILAWNPAYGLYPSRKMLGTCVGDLRVMKKGREKSGVQPHYLRKDLERGSSPLGRDQP